MACSNCPKVECPIYLDAHCVVYTGPNLSNLGLTTNVRLDKILQEIDELIYNGGFSLFTQDTNTITLSGEGTNSSKLSATLKVGSTDNTLTSLLAWDGSSVKKVSKSSLKDELVKVSSNDTTSGYLFTKLVAGTNIALTEQNDGANESVLISASFTEADAVALAKNITLNSGTGIQITGTATQSLGSSPVWTIAHGDTSSVTNLDTTGAQVIDQVTFDGFGHVQTITTRNLTLSDLGYTASPYPVSIGFSGTSTKTLTLTLSDSTVLTATFTDITSSGGTGISDAFISITDGTHTASAASSDTIKFRSGNTLLDVLVTDNDVTHGDNVLYTVNTGVLAEFIQDTVSAAVTDSSSIDFTYNDALGTITATVVDSYVRGLFSAGTGISYNNVTGQISSSVSDTNFAQNNLTFTGNRSHNLSNNSLTLTSGSSFTFTTLTSSGLSGNISLSPSSGTYTSNYLGSTEYARVSHNHNGTKPWADLVAHGVSSEVKVYAGTDELLLYVSSSSIPVKIQGLPLSTTSYVLYYDNATGKLSYGAAPSGGGGGEPNAFIEIWFKVGDTDAPASGSDTAFILTDCDGTPLTGKKISFYLERYRLFPGDDFEYDPLTAEITMTVPLKTGQRVMIEAYPSTDWTTCVLGTGPGSGFPYTFPSDIP